LKTADDFWNVIGLYNSQTIYYQIALIVIGIFIVGLLYFKKSDIARALLNMYFSFSFAWIGAIFFLANDKSTIGLFFAAPLFIALSILFMIDVFRKKNHYSFPKDKLKKKLSFISIIIFLLYPAISILIGHRYPEITTLIMPCPLTVFAIIMLSMSIPKINRYIYILLLIWAITGLPKIFMFNVPEDILLFISGLVGIFLLVINWKKLHKQM